MQKVCGILACDVVRSDRNLLTILREILPSSSGTRQYVFPSRNFGNVFPHTLRSVTTSQ